MLKIHEALFTEVSEPLKTLIENLGTILRPAPAPAGGGRPSKFLQYTVTELKELARKRGIKYSGLRKTELIAALQKKNKNTKSGRPQTLKS